MDYTSLTPQDIKELQETITRKSVFIEHITEELKKTLVGQDVMVERLMIGLLTQGHILLEGVPGLAKTLAIKSLAQCINVNFSRIQFTPDLLPTDIVGTMIYNPSDHSFEVKKGPIFSNFILADEINRAPAKVQSALLEAMQERQVTIGDTTFKLAEPFLVLATQNPIDQEGTYMLPEAQVDRFMLKVVITYPQFEEERIIIRQSQQSQPQVIRPVIQPEAIIEARQLVKKIYMDEKLEKYILDFVFASRNPQDYQMGDYGKYITYGASPRASINLAHAAKAYAFMNQRAFVIPEDVRAVCHDVLRHRIGLSYEAEADSITSTDIIDKILKMVQVP